MRMRFSYPKLTREYCSWMVLCRSKLHDDEPSNFDDAKTLSDWFKIDLRLQDQASRIQSKIQDSREEIKKQQVKTSYRISIKRFFQKPNSTVLFYKRIFSNLLKLPEWVLSDNWLPIGSNRLPVTRLVFKMFSNDL